MDRPPVVFQAPVAKLNPAPINPDWIRDGNPQARNYLIRQSTDTLGAALMWDCSAGKFDWHYDVDELIHIVEGSAIISDDHSEPRRVGPGDIVFFPRGSVAHWHVESYVRKVAYIDRPVPFPLDLAVKVLRRIKNMVRPAPESALMPSTIPSGA